MLPLFEFSLILNRSKSARPGLPVTPKYLYNETVLSHFSFHLSLSVNVASVESGTVNDVSSTLLVFGVF